MPLANGLNPTPTSGLTNSLMSTANGIIAYAKERMAAVDGFVSDLSSAVLTLQAPTITPQFPTGGSAPAIAAPDMPTFTAPVWQAPGFPREFTGTLDTSDLEIAPFDESPPTIQYGAAPPPLDIRIPDAPGVNLEFEDPALQVNLPDPPRLLSLNIEKFSGLKLPTFDAEAPTLTAVEPSIREYTPEDVYTSDLLEKLKSTLQERIASGSGLSQEVENAIWDRGREREARAQADALLQLEQMESLGYARPPGGYMDARTKILTETDAALRGHSREVMVKSAELALDNVKHAITTAVQLEGQLLNYTNSVEQRLFDASRYATEAGISIYNAKVQAFGAMVDVYRSKVQAYQALVQAETSRVEAYRAQVAAEEAKASVNRALVDQYRVMADVAMSNIEIYKARIAGIQTKAEIEKAKVQVFGEQVRGYVAQVNAYTAGVEGFRATIQAEQTKQQVYQSQVEAYTARVTANSRQVDARIAVYKGKIDAHTAELDGYRAMMQAESARVDSIVKTNSVVAEAFRSEVTAVSAYNDVLTKQWQATLDQNQRTAEIGISAAKSNAELYITTRSLALDAAKTGAQVAAQIGSAAINAVNFSGSVSSSEGYNASVSVSESSSNSDSTSNSTNYNYNSSV